MVDGVGVKYRKTAYNNETNSPFEESFLPHLDAAYSLALWLTLRDVVQTPKWSDGL